VQRLKRAIETPGTKPDLEIFRLLAREMGLDLSGEAGKARRADLAVKSAQDTLFTSGTLGRYSKMLNAVKEAPGGLYRG
jgi:hypothetical protein